jgi:hypothetical protein
MPYSEAYVQSFEFVFGFADVSGGQDMTGYYPRETDRAGYHSLRENEAIGASYDRYLRNGVQTEFFILYA